SLSEMPYRPLEQLRRSRRCSAVCSRRHARRAGSASAGHPHIYRVEAALGCAPIGNARGGGVLRSRTLLAEGKSRAPRCPADGKGPPVASLDIGPNLVLGAQMENDEKAIRQLVTTSLVTPTCSPSFRSSANDHTQSTPRPGGTRIKDQVARRWKCEAIRP